MKLSKRCEYGIKAAVRLTQSRGTGYTQSREIADAEVLPAKFLESILLALRSANILESKVGAGGGYRLARSADSVRVADLIAALERPEAESDVGNASSQPRTGQMAIDLINERIEQSLMEAVGSLSLADLAAMADDRVGGLTGVGR
jgi:Rrf2 family protein